MLVRHLKESINLQINLRKMSKQTF